MCVYSIYIYMFLYVLINSITLIRNFIFIFGGGVLKQLVEEGHTVTHEGNPSQQNPERV